MGFQNPYHTPLWTRIVLVLVVVLVSWGIGEVLVQLIRWMFR